MGGASSEVLGVVGTYWTYIGLVAARLWGWRSG